MPKKRVGGRPQRRRTLTTADNLHQNAARQAQKVSYTAAGRRLIRKIIGWSLMSLGLLVVASHLVVHLGHIAWLPTTGMQDLFTGYPMGGLLLIGGMITVSKGAVT